MPEEHKTLEGNDYFADQENPTEMARLMMQDRLINLAMGGIWPEIPKKSLSQIHQVLDVACGTGGWILEAARLYPKKHFYGIDVSHLMIDYATTQAKEWDTPNAQFQVMDATQPLHFSDSTFDLVNGRLLLSFLSRESWPVLLQECNRILRPGGIVRLTEIPIAESTGRAFSLLHHMLSEALWRKGCGFCPSGLQFGCTAALPLLLEDAGYQNIEQRCHILPFGRLGTQQHQANYENMKIFFASQIYPLLHKYEIDQRYGLTTYEDYQRLVAELLTEMAQKSFNAVWYYHTVIGTRL